jgi:hypothetical protein
MGSLPHPIGVDKVPGLPRRVWACVVRMGNQLLTGCTWLLVEATDNLRQDFSRVIGCIKTPPFRRGLTGWNPVALQAIVSMNFGDWIMWCYQSRGHSPGASRICSWSVFRTNQDSWSRTRIRQELPYGSWRIVKGCSESETRIRFCCSIKTWGIQRRWRTSKPSESVGWQWTLERARRMSRAMLDTEANGWTSHTIGCLRSLSPLSSGLIGWLGIRFAYIRMK